MTRNRTPAASTPAASTIAAVTVALCLCGALAGCSSSPHLSGGGSSAGSSARPGSQPPGHWTAPRTPADASARTSPTPPANKAVIGLVLSGTGSHLVPPTSPTYKPYSEDCHRLVDPGFTGNCIIAAGPAGTVAGVVEEERGAFGAQERDLVWHRQGASWALAEVHTFQGPGLPTLLWRGTLSGASNPDLIFITPTDQPRFGNELDVVAGTGTVTLYRFLGDGFAVAPPTGGLVTYVPGWTEQRPADSFYDQTLIGYSDGQWRVFSQQYVPYVAALAQHRGELWGPDVLAAS